eukprot:scaffold85_cov358-Pavlova_lutheri.AAC.41
MGSSSDGKEDRQMTVGGKRPRKEPTGSGITKGPNLRQGLETRTKEALQMHPSTYPSILGKRTPMPRE